MTHPDIFIELLVSPDHIFLSKINELPNRTLKYIKQINPQAHIYELRAIKFGIDMLVVEETIFDENHNEFYNFYTLKSYQQKYN